DGEDGAFHRDIAIGGDDLERSTALFGGGDDDVTHGEMDGGTGPTAGYVNLGPLVHFHFRTVIQAEDGGGVFSGADGVIFAELGARGERNERTVVYAIEHALDLFDGGAGSALERGEFIDGPPCAGSRGENESGRGGPDGIVDAPIDMTGRGHDD